MGVIGFKMTGIDFLVPWLPNARFKEDLDSKNLPYKYVTLKKKMYSISFQIHKQVENGN